MTLPETAPDWERHVYDFLEAPVPDEVRTRGVLTIADVIAATAAGAEIDYNDRLTSEAAFAGGHASIIGGHRTVAPGHASLVNAAAAITQEIEEGPAR